MGINLLDQYFKLHHQQYSSRLVGVLIIHSHINIASTELVCVLAIDKSNRKKIVSLFASVTVHEQILQNLDLILQYRLSIDKDFRIANCQFPCFVPLLHGRLITSDEPEQHPQINQVFAGYLVVIMEILPSFDSSN